MHYLNGLLHVSAVCISKLKFFIMNEGSALLPLFIDYCPIQSKPIQQFSLTTLEYYKEHLHT